MYALQMLNDHPLERLKAKLLGPLKEERESFYDPVFVIPVLQRNLSETIFKHSVFNPVSHQGLMILAMIINTNLIKDLK